MIGLDTNIVMRYLAQEAELAWKPLRALQHRGIDFSDALIGLIGMSAGCKSTVTFDREAAKLDGFGMLK